jgi:LuxR family maltose regulon positive regulatory protein
MEEGSKTHVAAAQRHIIERPRLTKLLDESTARIILLTAPAGYGKTTLARQWAAEKPHVSYECGIESSDIAAMALGIATAARSVCPAAEKGIRRYLETQASNESRRLAAVLAHELAPWPPETWLVVDDYHVLGATPAAEAFFYAVTRRVGLQLLLASRVRPAWLTERMLAYGEVAELTQAHLGMDDSEGRAALADVDPDAAQTVLTRAAGWPAAIGLAAVARKDPGSGGFSSELYAYLAEELYGRLSRSAKAGLIALSQSPHITQSLVRGVMPRRGGSLLREAEANGFLARLPRTAEFGMHPLLRDFLDAKWPEAPQARQIHRRLVEWLLDQHRWDDAFAALARHGDLDLLFALVSRSSIELLRLGRGRTLSAWVTSLKNAGYDDPLLTIIESELAFREGDYHRAATFAQDAVLALDDDDDIASRAWRNFAHASYFGEKPQAAFRQYLRAKHLARNDDDRADAVWGAFCCTAYVGDRRAFGLLEELATLPEPSQNLRLRLATGKVQLGLSFGGAEAALAAATEAEPLLDTTGDVMVRTSFLNIWSTLLVANARYDDAEPVLERAAADAEAAWLAFIPPLLDVRRAMLEAGRGRYARASAILDRVERRPNAARDDLYVRFSALRTRIRLLAVGRAVARVDAKAFPEEPDIHDVPTAAYAEYLAALALLAAAQNRADDALRLCDKVERRARTIEPHLDTLLVRAVVADQVKDRRRTDVAAAAFDEAERTGIWDGFVFTYRVSESLIRNMLAGGRPLATITAVMSRAGDEALARKFEPRRPNPRTKRADELTRREREILHLVAQGMTNDEIARALFLAPVTVKVHLRHVFAKLGVRSRTEAALRAQAQDLV